MGAMLPKPVKPIVVKRSVSSLFRIGFAEMNGWRKNMEDAHVMFTRDTWGFFGVFDGHGGDQCSAFIARRFEEELAHGIIKDDATMTDLALRLDREFLETNLPSGSTGTFVLVEPPAKDEEGYLLRVGNIGDSRVLLGRADGSIVEGPGTDHGLTTDHKPDHPVERARIERTGGTVQDVQGVARVNGDLAVSRAFGDAQYKQNGGPTQKDHPVSAEPDLTRIRCSSTDFVVLVCDGISEGDFPNGEVVKLIAQELKAGDPPDVGAAAASVCRKALEAGSRDNLSCMIVLLGGGEPMGPETCLLPEPFEDPRNGGYRKAYAAMAKHAGLTLAQAVEMRYDVARRERAQLLTDNDDGRLAPLRKELAAFGEGPPADLKCGSEERTKWFDEWLDAFDVEEDPDPGSMSREQLVRLVQERPDFRAMAMANGMLPPEPPLRRAVVATEVELRQAIDEIPTLKWNDQYAKLCGKVGEIIHDDESDGTSNMRFKELNIEAWFPTCALTEIEPRKVRVVAEVEELKAAVDAISTLKWHERMAHTCGHIGAVLVDDPSDGTAQVRFSAPLLMTIWLPNPVLSDVTEEAASDGSDANAEMGESRETEEVEVGDADGDAPDPKRSRLA